MGEVGQRVKQLREALRLSQSGFGAEVARVIGGPVIGQGKVSKWERGKVDRYTLAAIAWVHPTDAAGCFRWLLGHRPTMPGLPVDFVAGEPSPAAPGKMQVDRLPRLGAAHTRKRRRAAGD